MIKEIAFILGDLILSNESDKLQEHRKKLKQSEENALLYEESKAINEPKKRRGFFRKVGRLYFKQVPMAILNVKSLHQNNKFIVNSIKGISSPTCIQCNQGILMYDKNKVINNEVEWFCSKCDFTIIAGSSFSSVRDELQHCLPEVVQSKRSLWHDLTDQEKDELIKGHLSASKIYLFITFLLILFFGYQIYAKSILGILFAVSVLLFAFISSLKWGYRAWQVKSGNLFLAKSPFVCWLKNAKHYYSVDWVDESEDIVAKSE